MGLAILSLVALGLAIWAFAQNKVSPSTWKVSGGYGAIIAAVAFLCGGIASMTSAPPTDGAGGEKLPGFPVVEVKKREPPLPPPPVPEKAVGAQKLLATTEQDLVAALKHAAKLATKKPPGTVTPPPPKPPYTITKIVEGSWEIVVNVPETNELRTGIRFPAGHAVYVSTVSSHSPNWGITIPNLETYLMLSKGGKEIRDDPLRIGPEKYANDQSPPRIRLNPETADEAELCFGFPTGFPAVPRGEYHILVRKSNGPLEPHEYTPGVPVKWLITRK